VTVTTALQILADPVRAAILEWPATESLCVCHLQDELQRGRRPAAGCGEGSPYYAGATYQDWELDDPKGQGEATVRRIVGEIYDRVRRLLADLLPDLTLPPAVTRS
jgi:hypothetical protein